jgi:hypothetical protein
MACRRCGCRMIAKVGRTHPMLICTDCGLPMDQRESKDLARRRLWSAITLTILATVGGAMALLAAMNDVRTAHPLEESTERKEGGEREERGDEKSLFLIGPSGLTEEDSNRRPTRLKSRQGQDPGDVSNSSVAPKPVAEVPDPKPNHKTQSERKP